MDGKIRKKDIQKSLLIIFSSSKNKSYLSQTGASSRLTFWSQQNLEVKQWKSLKILKSNVAVAVLDSTRLQWGSTWYDLQLL